MNILKIEKNCLIPGAVFNIVNKIDNVDGNAIYLCRDMENNHFGVQFTTGFDIVKNGKSNIRTPQNFSFEQFDEFTTAKALDNIKSSVKTKYKDGLEDDDLFMDEIDSLIEEKGLGRKEAKSFEKDYLNNIVDELVLNDYKIQEGHSVRAALSFISGNSIVVGNDLKIPLLNSQSIVFDGDKPSKNGLYYVSKNRFYIPVLTLAKQEFSKGKYSYGNKAVVILNTNVMDKNALVIFLEHLVRTSSKTNGKYLPSLSIDEEINSTKSELIEFFEAFDKNTFNGKETLSRDMSDVSKLNNLIEKIKNTDQNEVFDVFKHITVFMPGSLSSCDIEARLNDSDNSFKTGVFAPITKSIAGFDFDMNTFISSFIKPDDKKNRTPVYCYYELGTKQAFSEKIGAGSSYGFMPNNLKTKNLMPSVSVLAELYSANYDKNAPDSIDDIPTGDETF